MMGPTIFPTARPAARPWLAAAGVLGLFTALVTIMTWPQVRYLARGVGFHDDPLLSIWRLAWIAHQLPRAPGRLFDGNIFYPEVRTLALSDAILAPGLIVAPLIWLGTPPPLVYNLLLLSGFALSGAATFLLVHRLTKSWSGALVAGIAFAFAPYRFSHYFHLELQMAWWMPLGLWALHRTIDTGRWRDAFLTACAGALQVMSSLYYGVFFVTFLAVVAPILLSRPPVGRSLRIFGKLIVTGSLLSLLLIPYALPYLANRATVGVRPESEIRQYSATPASYTRAPEENLLYGGPPGPGGMETNLFPGIILIALALYGAVPPISRVRLAYFVGLVFAIDASMGLNGVLYPWLHAHVMPYHGFRAPARFGIMVCLAMAVLAGAGAARLLAGIARPLRRRLVASILVAGMLVEFWSVPVYLTMLPERVPAVYAWLRDQPRTVVLELPLPAPDELYWIYDGFYMYFATYHWQPILNGYSGFYPASYLELLEVIRSFPDDASLRYLRRRGVDVIVVHTSLFWDVNTSKSAILRTPSVDPVPLLDKLGRTAGIEPVAQFGREGGPSYVFRLVR